MIRTLDDLIALTELEADKDPEFADITLLRTPGCSPAEIRQLENLLPGLPASYLEIAARVKLAPISIGYLELAPGKRDETPLVPRLIEVNNPSYPLWKAVDERRLYFVAEYPPHIVCVSREGTARPGEVVLLELSSPPEIGDFRVSPSFEQFLIGFGRICEQAMAGKYGDDAIEEVLHSLAEDFDLDEEQMSSWEDIVSSDLAERG